MSAATQKLLVGVSSAGRPNWDLYRPPNSTHRPPSLRELRRTHRSRLTPERLSCDLSLRWLPAEFEPDASAGHVLHALEPKRFLVDDAKAGNAGGILPSLPPLSSHPAATSVVARKMMQRLTDDLQWLKDSQPPAPPSLIGFLVSGSGSPAERLRVAGDLVQSLTAFVDESTVQTEAQIGELLTQAGEGGGEVSDVEKHARALAMAAGSEPRPSLELLAELLMSPDGEDVLRDLNPLLSDVEAYDLLDRTAAMLLRVSRTAHAARALVMAKQLQKELAAGGAGEAGGGGEAAVIAEQLAAALVVRRAHISPSDDTPEQHTFDPRLLLFEFATGFVLRPPQVALVATLAASAQSGQSVCNQMLMGEGKTTVISPLLALLLGNSQLVIQIVPPQLLAFALTVLRQCFAAGGALRKTTWTFSFDRRTPVTHALVDKARTAAAEGSILLGTPAAFKAFMLKLLELLHTLDMGRLAKGKNAVRKGVRRVGRALRLVRQKSSKDGGLGEVDMPALKAQSAWAVELLAVWRGGITVIDEVDIVLHPLRSELNWPLGDKFGLDFAPKRWEIPTHLLEALILVQKEMVPAAYGATTTFVEGPSMARKHFLSAVSLTEITDVEAPKEGTEAELIGRMRDVVHEGVASKQLQRIPHLVLLSPSFYHTQLRPLLAEWLLLWLRRQGLRDVTDEQILHCLSAGGANAEVEQMLSDEQVRMLNLGYDWLQSLLPHVLAKVDRVHFGLLRPEELERMSRNGTLPRSRRFLAVPFVGKDAPSPSSEYAHPDVAIGFAYLAYRYEGLRRADFGAVMSHLRAELDSESGPELQRPSAATWIAWVHSAPGERRVRGTAGARHQSGASARAARLAASSTTGMDALMYGDAGALSSDIMPLHLIDLADAEYLESLYDMLRLGGDVIKFYLETIVFPETTSHQARKLSANGQVRTAWCKAPPPSSLRISPYLPHAPPLISHRLVALQDLGGEMLFGTRIGFSGTPSSLLPLEMGECVFAKGDDAKMLRAVRNLPISPSSHDIR